MAWKKASAEMIAFFSESVAWLPCEKRKMFGYPCCFVNGNMFTGVHQDDIILRLSAQDQQALFSTWDEAALFEPMEGRPMKEYVLLPESLYNDPAVFREWLDRSFQYASSLPPKEPDTKKRR